MLGSQSKTKSIPEVRSNGTTHRALQLPFR